VVIIVIVVVVVRKVVFFFVFCGGYGKINLMHSQTHKINIGFYKVKNNVTKYEFVVVDTLM